MTLDKAKEKLDNIISNYAYSESKGDNRLF